MRMDEAVAGDIPKDASFSEFNAPKRAGLSIIAVIDAEGSPSMDLLRMLFLVADVRSRVHLEVWTTHMMVALTAIDSSDPN